MPAALYDIKDPRDRAAQHMQSAIGSYARQTQDVGGPPGKTAGGAIMNAGGGAMAGASMGSAAGPYGAAIGAVVGAAAYFLS